MKCDFIDIYFVELFPLCNMKGNAMTSFILFSDGFQEKSLRVLQKLGYNGLLLWTKHTGLNPASPHLCDLRQVT